MAKLDLKNAYYLLAVHPLHRRFLRFYFNDKLFEFTCLPFGLASAPFVFTKIMRPVISLLRSKGFKSVNYLDDFLLLGPSERACVRNVMATCAVLFSLGFLFSAQKCRFPPSTCCEFLGFEFNSVSMRMSLPANKRSALARLINKMAKQRSCTIRQYAQFLGSLAAACPAITYSRLYTKKFERDKYLALLRAKGDFNAIMQLPPRESEFSWWKDHILTGDSSLLTPTFSLEIFSDASTTGWGASCKDKTARGSWNPEERDRHINELELLAALFGLKSFSKNRGLI